MDHLEAMGNLASARAARESAAQLKKVQKNQRRQLQLDNERKEIEQKRLQVEENRAYLEGQEREKARQKNEEVRLLRSNLSDTITMFNEIKRHRPL